MNYPIQSLDEIRRAWPEFPRWPRAYISRPEFPHIAPVLAQWCFERVRGQQAWPRQFRLPASDVRRLHRAVGQERCTPAEAQGIVELFEQAVDCSLVPTLSLAEIGLGGQPELQENWDGLQAWTMLDEIGKLRRASPQRLLKSASWNFPSPLAYPTDLYRELHISVRTPPSLLPPVDDEAPPAPPTRPAVPFDPAMPWRREKAA